MVRIKPEILQAFMESKRGSQAEIAKRCQVSAGVVSQWKNGNRPIPAKHLPMVCEVLGVTPEDLSREFSPYVRDWMRTGAGQAILELLPSLTPDGLNRVLLMALQVQQSEKPSEPSSK